MFSTKSLSISTYVFLKEKWQPYISLEVKGMPCPINRL